VILALAGCLAAAPAAWAQPRPGIGYVYPAGGQQGATARIMVGGQNLDGVDKVFVSGSGVQAKVVENTKMTAEQARALREQAEELRKRPQKDEPTRKLLQSLQKKLNLLNTVNQASRAIAHQIIIEVTTTPDAAPGEREIRLETPWGLTNPLAFHVGQAPEVSAPPLPVTQQHVLGREEASLARRTLHEEARVTLPCTLNGQVTFGGVDRYRFEARKGQRLVASVQARQLVPYIADAVPGWFQAVLVLYDAEGKEVAYCDDYRFKPDPVIFFQVPQDGEYVLAIYDALYRGREDFVYRVTVGELPFVTGIFPLGGPAGATTTVELKGWNLPVTKLTVDNRHKSPGVYPLAVGNEQWVSNVVPFAVDTLPECLEREPNDSPATAQKVTLPIIVNGRIGRPGDRDVFRFEGRADEAIVAEVYARRLDSPLDSLLTLTDAAGKRLAMNDDQEDKTSGLNTHDADSYLTATLPADGTYYLYLADTQHHGGEEYAYRLRISAPQPDFALRVVPSSLSIVRRAAPAAKGPPSFGAPLSVYVFRRDGFVGDIRLELKDPPAGFSMPPVKLSGKQEVVQVTLRSQLPQTPEPVKLSIVGRATIGDREVIREAVAADDKMQAFAYHHLVPAQDLEAVVCTPPIPVNRPVSPKSKPAEAAKPAKPPEPAKPGVPAKTDKPAKP
jgi:hypothetical protein